MFPHRCLATISPDYKIGLFLHVLAVVLAFGPTFGYGVFISVGRSNSPRSVPAMLARDPDSTTAILVNPACSSS